MAAVLVAHTFNSGSSPSSTTAPATGTINTTGANLIVITIATEVNTAPTTLIMDNKANTYTQIGSTIGPSGTVNRIYYCFNPTVGTLHTFTVSIFAGHSGIAVQAWSGIVTSGGANVWDVNNASSYTLVNSVQPGSVTPTYTNEVAITGVGFDGGTASSATINTGFTISDQVGPSSNAGVGMAYLIASGVTALNPTWKFDSSNQASGGCPIVVFKADNSLLPSNGAGNFFMFMS